MDREREGEKEEGERRNVSGMERASRSSRWREETMEKQLSRNEQSFQTELGASWEARRGEERSRSRSSSKERRWETRRSPWKPSSLR